MTSRGPLAMPLQPTHFEDHCSGVSFSCRQSLSRRANRCNSKWLNCLSASLCLLLWGLHLGLTSSLQAFLLSWCYSQSCHYYSYHPQRMHLRYDIISPEHQNCTSLPHELIKTVLFCFPDTRQRARPNSKSARRRRLRACCFAEARLKFYPANCIAN